MNILITGIGGPTPRSIGIRLRELFPNAKLVGVDNNPKALGFYLPDLLDSKAVVPRADHPDYWPIMKGIVEEHQIDFAFVQPEVEIISWGLYYKEYREFITPVLLPRVEWSQVLINKARMAEILEETEFIPKTITITPNEPKLELINSEFGFPCWIRATVGSGGLGSLKVTSENELISWLKIHETIPEFTVSEFLPGRHLANQMLYVHGKLVRNAGLECAEYVMADIAPSKVTGNTSFGRLLSDDKLLQFCEDCMNCLMQKIGVEAHGVFSFDLKEDSEGNYKLTEINVRHMAYTGILAAAGFDLVKDTVDFLQNKEVPNEGRHHFGSHYIFLRDVDSSPILMKEEDLLNSNE